MKSIGICTSYSNYDNLTFELKSLYDEASLIFNEVLLINPTNVYYKFIREKGYPQIPQIIFNDENIQFLDTIIFRSTKGREKSIALLAHSLFMGGTNIIDPLSRFSVGQSSKLLSTLERFKKGIGISTYIAFTSETTELLLNNILGKGKFPIIAKDFAGNHSDGFIILDNIEQAILYSDEFFSSHQEDTPIFFQEYIDFIKEFRVLMIDNQVIGIKTKNKHKGKRKTSIKKSQVVEFVKNHCDSGGIVGVDVGVDIDDDIYIIEANRSPEWKGFQNKLGINVAKEIIEHISNMRR